MKRLNLWIAALLLTGASSAWAADNTLDSDLKVEITCTVGSIIMGWDFTNSRTDDRTLQGHAGTDLTVAQSSPWALGSIVCGFVYETLNSGDGYTVVAKKMALKNYGADPFDIHATAATTTGAGDQWSPGADAGANTYKLQGKIAVGAENTDFAGAVTITSDNKLNVAQLASGGWVDFDLRFTAPTSTTSGAAKSIIVTIVAK